MLIYAIAASATRFLRHAATLRQPADVICRCRYFASPMPYASAVMLAAD